MSSTKLMQLRPVLEAFGGATAGFTLYGLLQYEAQYIEVCNYPSPSHHLAEPSSSVFSFVATVLQHGSTWALIGAIGVLGAWFLLHVSIMQSRRRLDG